MVHVVLNEEKKNFCAGKESVLIDDLDRNIRRWTEAGGTGIHYVDGVTDVLAALDAIEKSLNSGK